MALTTITILPIYADALPTATSLARSNACRAGYASIAMLCSHFFERRVQIFS